MAIIVTIKGGKEIEAKLAKLGSSIYKMRTGMAILGQEISRYYTDEVFNSQGQVLGQTWARLKPATSLGKLKAGYTRYATIPLIRTGLMRNSFTFEAGESSLKIGNLQDYFKYHQFGTERTPKRPMIGINNSIKRTIAEVVKREVIKKLESV